jgi:beta-glucanase (GH16 family)
VSPQGPHNSKRNSAPTWGRHPVSRRALAEALARFLLFALLVASASSALSGEGPFIAFAHAAETQPEGAPLDRAGLVSTFSDDFTAFSWFGEGLPNVPRGGGTWRTNFGYAGVQELGSRTLPSNGEMQIYVDRGFRGAAQAPLGIDPFRVTKGGLEIIADRAPDAIKPHIWNYQYTSGLITTLSSFSQLYGVFEMRARVPNGKGLWPAFWLLPTNRTWPPEIDVFEILGNDPSVLHTNAHSKATGKHTDAPSVIHIADASAEFHTYAVDWEDDDITWYFDGAEVARKPTPSDMHTPMYLLVNLAVGGNWPGSPDASVRFPAVLAIQWIHAYRRNT